MTTWVEFERAGFWIVRGRGAPTLHGPDDSRLLEELRFELASRADVTGAGESYAINRVRYGRCSHCGDEMARADVAGTCGLCELARAKAIGAIGR